MNNISLKEATNFKRISAIIENLIANNSLYQERLNKEKERLKDAIKHVAHKNVQMIPKWKEENPDYCHDEGRANDEYLKIIMQSMGGSDKQEDDVYQNKIISKLAKHVIIEKSNDLQKEIPY